MTQKWPTIWKKSKITPPYPKLISQQNIRSLYNVRSVTARAFEKTVYNNFSKEILKSYLSQNQFAYRQGGSCINALIKMHHNILKALDNSNTKAVRLFSMDFSKAFDNVKHNLLVEKLKNNPLSP